MDLVTRLLIVSVLALPVISAKPTFEKSGVVIIPRADFSADGGKLTARFRATRWGMYDLMIEGTADAGLQAKLNGQEFVGFPAGPGHLGKFYMKKAGPCVIELNGTAGGVIALRLVPACEGKPVVPEKGKAIELDARDCRISGVTLRYEPNPKKLCIGFWGNPEERESAQEGAGHHGYQAHRAEAGGMRKCGRENWRGGFRRRSPLQPCRRRR